MGVNPQIHRWQLADNRQRTHHFLIQSQAKRNKTVAQNSLESVSVMLFMKEIISFICRKGTFVHSKVWLTLSSNLEGESYLVSPPLSLSWGSETTRQVEGSFHVSSSKPAISCSYDFFMFMVHYHYRTEHEYYRVHRAEEGQYHTINIIYIYKIYMFFVFERNKCWRRFLTVWEWGSGGAGI